MTCLVVAFGSLSNSSWAQQALSLEELYDLPLEELLKIPVRSSTLTDKSLQSAPSSVTVFSHNQIRNLGVEYLHELINYVPGFQAFRQGESGDEYYHSARGHRSSTSSREVLILIDGVRVNREFDNAVSVPMLSLHSFEKVEFIRGPGSALYGSNAFLGVIVITTHQGQNELQASIGENGHTHVQGMGSVDFRGWKGDLSFNLYQEDGETFGLEDPGSFTIVNSRDPRSGEDFQISVHNATTRINATYYLRESEDFYVLEDFGNGLNSTENSRWSIELDQALPWQTPLATKLNIQLLANQYQAQTTTPTVGQYHFKQQESVINVSVTNNWEYSDDQSLQFGIEYRSSDINETILYTEFFGPLLLYSGIDKDNTGIYVQTQNHFQTGTELLLGIRYDDYQELGSALSPRLGVVQTLSDNQTLKLLYGEAFRTPTVNELLLENLTGGFTGNPNLDPETIASWEIVWTGKWENQYLSINAFYNTISDLIERTDTTTVSTFMNQDSTESFHGFEIEYSIQLLEHCMLSANYSSIRNLPDSDFRQAEQLASMILNYNQDRWNLNVSATYNSERDMLIGTNQRTLGGFWLFNAKWQFTLDNRLSFDVIAKNLLDKDYVTPTQLAVHTIPIPNRGRELIAGVKLKF